MTDILPLDIKHNIEWMAFKMNYNAVIHQIPTSKPKTSNFQLEWSCGDDLVLTVYYQCYSKVNAQEIMEEVGGCECDNDTYSLKWSGENAMNVIQQYKLIPLTLSTNPERATWVWT